MTTFSPWERATECTSGPAPGARALMTGCLEAFGDQGATNLGIFNCRDVRGEPGTLSCHSEGRACDVGFPTIDGRANPAGHQLVGLLLEDPGRLGLQAIIYDRTIYSARSPEGRPYTGASPHYDHVHIELTRQAGRDLTLPTVRQVVGTGGSGTGATPASGERRPVLRRGSRGPDTVRLQQLLGVAADGIFGGETERAVRAFQSAQGDITVDGIVGPATWERLGE